MRSKSVVWLVPSSAISQRPVIVLPLGASRSGIRYPCAGRRRTRHSERVGLELRGSVLLRDFQSSDRDDFVALVHDEAMFEFMKFRLDEASAPQYFDYFVAEPHTTPRRSWDLVIESPDREFTGWAGL